MSNFTETHVEKLKNQGFDGKVKCASSDLIELAFNIDFPCASIKVGAHDFEIKKTFHHNKLKNITKEEGMEMLKLTEINLKIEP